MSQSNVGPCLNYRLSHVALPTVEEILSTLRREGQVHVIVEEGTIVPSLAEMALEAVAKAK